VVLLGRVSHRQHAIALAALPYRGRFGNARPAALNGLALPPSAMPGRLRSRPLKAWRYVGVFAPELMLCVASVRIGRARQSFWAVWDRRHARLHERTALGRGDVVLARGSVSVRGRDMRGREVRIELALDERPGIESVCVSGDRDGYGYGDRDGDGCGYGDVYGYGWTCKQGGIAARGTVTLAGTAPVALDAQAVVDDTAAYYERHTRWRWSAGVGRSTDGRALAWNLVTGVNDPASGSERTVWVDGEPYEPPPVSFDDDLSGVGGLRFTAEATRSRRENLLLIRNRYRQPFGTFSGSLGRGAGFAPIALAHGLGVMEDHEVWW
jgi:hypothetical protein